MASQTIDELTFNLEIDGVLVRKELEKVLISYRGSWATVVYLFTQMNKKTGEYCPPRVSLIKYQRVEGIWKRKLYFNINTTKSAEKIIGALGLLKDHIGNTNKENEEIKII